MTKRHYLDQAFYLMVALGVFLVIEVVSRFVISSETPAKETASLLAAGGMGGAPQSLVEPVAMPALPLLPN